MQYTRIYADSEGESHMEDVAVDLALVDFAPPAPPLLRSSFTPAQQTAFLGAPRGWVGDWHPVPRRQWMFFLQGETEVQTSDGNVRRFGPGDVVLFEDTHGKGHASRNSGAGETMTAIVQVPDATGDAQGA